MRHYKFMTTGLAVMAFFGIMNNNAALAAYIAESGISTVTSPETRVPPGSFQLAITVGDPTAPLVIPPEKESPPIPKKATQEKTIKKVKKAKVNKPAAPEKKEEPGFFSRTLDKLMGNEDKSEKAADKKPAKEEPGLLTKTLKKLMGGDEDKAKEDTNSNPLDPTNVGPTASANKKAEEDKKPTTAKSETKATLKSSFKTLIGVDAAKDKAKAQAAEPAATQSAKQEKSGLSATFNKILGGGDKKDKPAGKASSDTQQAEKTTSTPAKQAQAKEEVQPDDNDRKYLGQKTEEEQIEENRGGVKKGKNLLKESFKTLVKEEEEKGE